MSIPPKPINPQLQNAAAQRAFSENPQTQESELTGGPAAATNPAKGADTKAPEQRPAQDRTLTDGTVISSDPTSRLAPGARSAFADLNLGAGLPSAASPTAGRTALDKLADAKAKVGDLTTNDPYGQNRQNASSSLTDKAKGADDQLAAYQKSKDRSSWSSTVARVNIDKDDAVIVSNKPKKDPDEVWSDEFGHGWVDKKLDTDLQAVVDKHKPKPGDPGYEYTEVPDSVAVDRPTQTKIDRDKLIGQPNPDKSKVNRNPDALNNKDMLTGSRTGAVVNPDRNDNDYGAGAGSGSIKKQPGIKDPPKPGENPTPGTPPAQGSKPGQPPSSTGTSGPGGGVKQ